MKTIEQLEQEAKQARDSAIEVLNLETFNKALFVNRIIEASVAMVTYQLALGMEDADQIWNESGTKVISEKLPEVLQAKKEGDSDGWIEWHGKGMPNLFWLDVKFRNGQILNNCFSDELRWWHAKDKNVNQDIYDEGVDIIAYKVASGKDNNAKLAQIKSKKEN